MLLLSLKFFQSLFDFELFKIILDYFTCHRVEVKPKQKHKSELMNNSIEVVLAINAERKARLFDLIGRQIQWQKFC